MTRYHLLLCVLFLGFWIWAAVDPVLRDGWWLENILVFIFVPLILLSGYYFRLSNVSYTLITIFLILHVIGSHYTYAEVPFGYTLQDWFGETRNMYDRLVHFSFGFLLYYPVREVFIRISKIRGVWAYYFPLDLVLAGSALYEIMEWLTAALVDPNAGLAFLGTQDDIWDAQKDMLMAGIGALIALLIVFVIKWMVDRNHWREIAISLRIPKDDKPLGENKLREYLKNW